MTRQERLEQMAASIASGILSRVDIPNKSEVAKIAVSTAMAIESEVERIIALKDRNESHRNL